MDGGLGEGLTISFEILLENLGKVVCLSKPTCASYNRFLRTKIQRKSKLMLAMSTKQNLKHILLLHVNREKCMGAWKY